MPKYKAKKRNCTVTLPEIDYQVVLPEITFIGESISEIRVKINEYLDKEFKKVITELIGTCPQEVSIQIDKKTAVLPVRYDVGQTPRANVIGSIHQQLLGTGPAVRLPKATSKRFKLIKEFMVEKKMLWTKFGFEREILGKLVEVWPATDEEILDAWVNDKTIMFNDSESKAEHWKLFGGIVNKTKVADNVDVLIDTGKTKEACDFIRNNPGWKGLSVLSLTEQSLKMFYEMDEENRVMKKSF